MPRRKLLIAFGAAIALLEMCQVAAGIFLCEITLHPYVNPSTAAVHVTRPVSVITPDKLKLRAWYETPVTSNGSCVLLLHGVSDTHLGVSGIAES